MPATFFFLLSLDMHLLENDLLQVAISPHGAELQKLFRKDTGLDYLWSGDPAFWGKFSPVLFPIVGTLKGNHYRYQGTDYTLPRHGFAREKQFLVEQAGPAELTCTLQDDESTRVVYPFRFLLRLTYTLAGNRLTVGYTVLNPDEKPLYFSLGAHPAFAVPLEKGAAYHDYRLVFNQPETAVRWGLQDGLLLNKGEAFLDNSREIPLSVSLFERDAIVMKGLRSEQVSLVRDGSDHGWTFGFPGWPHLGIWAAKGAPFVCIEPWQGHADPVDHNGDITHKPGIVKLEPMDSWQGSWWIEVF
jgi:galactose mutarotase-like enzyme